MTKGVPADEPAKHLDSRFAAKQTDHPVLARGAGNNMAVESVLGSILTAWFAGMLGAPQVPQTPPHPVLELRQYKLVTGKEAEFVQLFDREFVDTQEALGIRLVGQFTDHDTPDRFTWFREFPTMEVRAKSLNDFYFGPVWAAHKATANPMLDDNDNVLFLRAAAPDSGFGPLPARTGVAANSMVFVTIEYLWKDPNEGFSKFFLEQASPLLGSAGLPVLGAYVPEEEANNFPRLPLRPKEKVFVWVTRATDLADYQRKLRSLHDSPGWKNTVAAKLADAEERPPQVLRLTPTPRSALR
jgi:hypothetical protein